MGWLDTADLYGGGLAEEIVGKVIKGRRDKVFVASKFNPKENPVDSVISSVEKTLRRMGTDYLDLYQLHWPNPLLSMSEIMKALTMLVDNGRIRYIGVSNFSLEEFIEAWSYLATQTIVSNQLEYNLIDRSVEYDFLPFCQSHGATLIAYSALNQGRFLLEAKQKEVLNDLADKYKKTIPQIILRWLISHEAVVAISRSNNMAHTRENASSADFDLDDNDILTISEHYAQPSIEVPLKHIRLNVTEKAPIYMTRKEALDNKFDMIPSPLVLSKIIKKRKKYKTDPSCTD